MTANPFQPAKRRQTSLKIAIIGAAGTGKTFTASKIAQQLGQKTAVVDTEGAFHLYADIFPFDLWESPDAKIATVMTAHKAALAHQYNTLIIDNLSDNWQAVLAGVEADKARSKNQYGAWNNANSQYEAMIEEIKRSPLHVIGTVRASIANHVGDVNPDLEAFGLKPEIRTGAKGVLYEFQVVLAMLQSNRALVVKSRCTTIRNGTFIIFDESAKREPGQMPFSHFIKTLIEWANVGAQQDFTPTTFTATHATLDAETVTLGGKTANDTRAYLIGEFPTVTATANEWTPLPSPLTVSAVPTHAHKTILGVSLPVFRDE